MTNEVDLSFDWMADAVLTTDQRMVWDALRTETLTLREKSKEMAARIKILEDGREESVPTLLTRPDFNREVARMLAFDERYGGISSVLYFDLENMDALRQHRGEAMVNTVTREMAEALAENVRTSDVLGRLAPDEYGVLLLRCDNVSAWRKAETLAYSLQRRLSELDGGTLNIKVSFGAYTFRDTDDLSVGLKEAAQAMTQVAS